ncbi:glyoxylase-like metal-dependent hydrolase (beta-lactamase superfamily II) [Tumebacillus sp. BK434]|uniref:MBL fold metallo-hydrolase n=1 Tax=Tumebacillus sp. BK434 TaxID=2512169 RepID=UPI00104FBB94|nr:MBL fold metallo-hydrolase [Tumebacillus sp. BK434]TCP55775.1 glyoxylase-like metal-dependent hydrolase (beta-lactamase superfamily II) [Tumebacillus sp. BK434]
MKIEQVSDHIWCLKSWLVILTVRVWVVVEKDGVTLVDAGMPFMAKGILKFLQELNAGPLKRIVLTHGHGDHVGAVQAILKQHAVPVSAHAIEMPYLEGELPYPRRKKAEAGLPKGLVQTLSQDEESLQAVGSLQPYLTPGHSPGHVVYFHEQDGVLLAGDLFTSKHGLLKRPMPMFTADMAEAVRSSAILKELQPKRLEICHSRPVMNPAEQVDRYLRENAGSK